MAATRRWIRPEYIHGLKLFSGSSKAQVIPDHAVRIVTVTATPHSSRGKGGGGSTGRKTTKRIFEMVCFFLSGWAILDEMERHIEALPQPV